MKKTIFSWQFLFLTTLINAQSMLKSMLKWPDTGQTGDFTATFGEDSDYNMNSPFYIKNNNGTVTDTITGLMWQQADGGEMTYEKAIVYADTLTLGGFTDWRLPTPHESYSILNLQRQNPALDITVFTTTTAEYWWTNSKQVNDATKAWVTNAGGGIGNHALSETISAGGTKKFHVRAVRDTRPPITLPSQFTNNGNSTIKDEITGLIWQQTPNPDTLTWENALTYAENLTLGGFSDWRLPNIKELQSLSDERIVVPSISPTFFPAIGSKKYWSSTTLSNQTTRAWYLSTQVGITTYDLKTLRLGVICVRGNSMNATGLKEMPKKQHSLKILQNPIYDNSIHFERSDRNDDFLLQLLDMQGKVLFYEHYKKQDCDMQMSVFIPDLKTGVYLLRLESANLVETAKIISIR